MKKQNITKLVVAAGVLALLATAVSNASEATSDNTSSSAVFSHIRSTYNIPSDLMYTTTHFWVMSIGGDLYRVGLTDFGQEDIVGDVVFVDLPAVDDTFESGESVGSIESIKCVIDLTADGFYGTVTEINEALDDSPGNINSDPYASWIFEFRGGIVSLLDAEAYGNLIGNYRR